MYKRQPHNPSEDDPYAKDDEGGGGGSISGKKSSDAKSKTCLLYTSDAADERSSVDLGGRRIIKKKNK